MPIRTVHAVWLCLWHWAVNENCTPSASSIEMCSWTKITSTIQFYAPKPMANRIQAVCAFTQRPNWIIYLWYLFIILYGSVHNAAIHHLCGRIRNHGIRSISLAKWNAKINHRQAQFNANSSAASTEWRFAPIVVFFESQSPRNIVAKLNRKKKTSISTR